MKIEDAVERAITECIEEDVLKDMLMKSRSEVKMLSLMEYDEELHEQTLREDGRDQVILNALRNGHSPEEVADFNGLPLVEVLAVQETMFEEK